MKDLPERLRERAVRQSINSKPKVEQLLMDAASEIENLRAANKALSSVSSHFDWQPMESLDRRGIRLIAYLVTEPPQYVAYVEGEWDHERKCWVMAHNSKKINSPLGWVPRHPMSKE